MNFSESAQLFFAKSVRSKLAEFAGFDQSIDEKLIENNDTSPTADFVSASMRRTVVGTIVKQARYDANWRSHFAEVMRVNRIKPEEIEAELHRHI